MILKLKFNNKLHFQCYFDHFPFPFWTNKCPIDSAFRVIAVFLLHLCLYRATITYAVYYTHISTRTHTFHLKTYLFAYNWHLLLLLQIHCHPPSIFRILYAFCAIQQPKHDVLYFIPVWPPLDRISLKKYNQIWQPYWREVMLCQIDKSQNEHLWDYIAYNTLVKAEWFDLENLKKAL